MTSSAVRLRERAAADIDHAISYYLDDAGAGVTTRFIDAIERTIKQVSRAPHAGSLQFAYELDIPVLRVRPVAQFPYLVFYVAGDEAADVWRILHSGRDMPTAFADESDD